jgi:GDPmannose 4,6-dehydratase
VHSAATTDFRSVAQVLSEVQPDETYLLAGQSSVGLSFGQPVETLESIALGTLNILEAIRFLKLDTRLYHAGSSECFGDVDDAADERTAFRPRSPYAVAKASAHWMVANYRDAYGLYACTGILFNHESPLRPTRFVTLDIERDWGWAPEYVDAMWRMLQQPEPDDYVIATGRMHALRDFVATAFTSVGLDWKGHVDFDPSLRRPSDIAHSVGDASKAEHELGWKASTTLEQVVARMMAAEQGESWPMVVV